MADDPDASADAPDVPAGPTHPYAIYSILLGLGAFASLYVFPYACLALGVPSITTGIHARRQIAASRGELTGDQLAVIGLTIGGGALVTGLVAYVLDIIGG